MHCIQSETSWNILFYLTQKRMNSWGRNKAGLQLNVSSGHAISPNSAFSYSNYSKPIHRKWEVLCICFLRLSIFSEIKVQSEGDQHLSAWGADGDVLDVPASLWWELGAGRLLWSDRHLAVMCDVVAGEGRRWGTESALKARGVFPYPDQRCFSCRRLCLKVLVLFLYVLTLNNAVFMYSAWQTDFAGAFLIVQTVSIRLKWGIWQRENDRICVLAVGKWYLLLPLGWRLLIPLVKKQSPSVAAPHTPKMYLDLIHLPSLWYMIFCSVCFINYLN